MSVLHCRPASLPVVRHTSPRTSVPLVMTPSSSSRCHTSTASHVPHVALPGIEHRRGRRPLTAEDDALNDSPAASPLSLAVPSLTEGLSEATTSSTGETTRSERSPPLCIYTYARYFAGPSLRPKDARRATFASDELYYYLRVSRGTRIINVPLGVGPSRPSNRLAQWRTLLAYIHSSHAEALELPAPVWRALHDLIRLLLWFWPQKWLPVNSAWCKFEEVICYSTRFDGGPIPDMTKWLLNLHSWLRDILPECPEDMEACRRPSRVSASSSLDFSLSELPDGYASDLWTVSDARQTFPLAVSSGDATEIIGRLMALKQQISALRADTRLFAMGLNPQQFPMLFDTLTDVDDVLFRSLDPGEAGTLDPDVAWEQLIPEDLLGLDEDLAITYPVAGPETPPHPDEPEGGWDLSTLCELQRRTSTPEISEVEQQQEVDALLRLEEWMLEQDRYNSFELMLADPEGQDSPVDERN
ncbi:hypothetical protein K466DRAFT_568413 [Polyporus arcularius HHB13444]|uniref:Uncharacterized protein n=1 Tax=Polyporus arcularius HHB13444 TaxID=1314778 RepID=A0A5C3P2E3_9APHY|nr:hypothetical protein K466DRAFT_568413 [Polyporus arcularius HHB13444]